jgi:hypothetical protein
MAGKVGHRGWERIRRLPSKCYQALPFFLIDLLASAVLMTRPARLGQIGRGMLIGWLSAPVSVAFFVSVFIAGKAIGL